MDERWLPVPGFDGLYSVSSLGRVRSEERKVPHVRCGLKTIRERILRPKHVADGYLFVTLSKSGAPFQLKIHRLVLLAFVGAAPEGQICRHLNGDPKDNRLANLEWGTHSENRDDALQHGRLGVGELAGNAKMTNASVAEMRTRYAAGETQKALAAHFNVTISTVAAIVTGRRWQEAPGPRIAGGRGRRPRVR